MIYATLDEAWSQKSRVRRVVKKEKNVQLPEKHEIVLKDPTIVSLLKDVPDPDAYILERIKPVTESFVPKKEPKEPKELNEPNEPKDDIIYFLYFLILLVLLY